METNFFKRFLQWKLHRKSEREKIFLLKYACIMPLSYKKFLASYYPDARVRKKYLEEIGVEFGEGSFVNMGFMKIPNSKKVEKVVLGSHVSVAANVVCICEANANNGVEINTFPYVIGDATCKGDIIIEDDVWVGANVTILPGITIGRCSIVGAGSVVTKDLESYGVYVGVPARKIRDVREPLA